MGEVIGSVLGILLSIALLVGVCYLVMAAGQMLKKLITGEKQAPEMSGANPVQAVPAAKSVPKPVPKSVQAVPEAQYSKDFMDKRYNCRAYISILKKSDGVYAVYNVVGNHAMEGDCYDAKIPEDINNREKLNQWLCRKFDLDPRVLPEPVPVPESAREPKQGVAAAEPEVRISNDSCRGTTVVDVTDASGNQGTLELWDSWGLCPQEVVYRPDGGKKIVSFRRYKKKNKSEFSFNWNIVNLSREAQGYNSARAYTLFLTDAEQEKVEAHLSRPARLRALEETYSASLAESCIEPGAWPQIRHPFFEAHPCGTEQTEVFFHTLCHNSGYGEPLFRALLWKQDWIEIRFRPEGKLTVQSGGCWNYTETADQIRYEEHVEGHSFFDDGGGFETDRAAVVTYVGEEMPEGQKTGRATGTEKDDVTTAKKHYWEKDPFGMKGVFEFTFTEIHRRTD